MTTSTELGASGHAPRDALRSSAPVEPHPGLGTPALLRLMQLSSSLCPIGAFAYSQGLEAAVERGWVTNEPSLVDWLLGLGEHALSRLDLPLLARAHRAARDGDMRRMLELGARMLASREAAELRAQERQLGSSLRSLLENLGVTAAAALREPESASYVSAFALGAVHFGIPAELALVGYAFAWCEQQVSAAARLVPLGHMAAQRALSALLGRVPAWVEHASHVPDEEIGSSTPGLAMGAAWHETQYTRLFRS